MKPKSGKAGKAVTPAAPEKAEDADNADPGKVEEIKAEQINSKSGKYGSQKVKPFKPPTEEEVEEKEEQLSWIEIELVDEEDEPVPGKKYKITLPDDSVAEGTLDDKGFARVKGFEKGTCKVSFLELDKEAWEKI
jgi:hypothetical protein